MANVFTRRQFLGTASSAVGMIGTLGINPALFPRWMPRMAFRDTKSAGSRGDVLIVIAQRGGMDGLSAVVPYADGGVYYDKRPTIAIRPPNSSGGAEDDTAIDLDGHFGLHPALRPLKDVYDAKQLAVIHAAGSPDPSRSHFDAMDYMERGTPGDRMTSNGWINRHLESAAWQNASPFRAVGIGSMIQTSLSGIVPALSLQSIADFHLNGRQDQLIAMQKTLAGLYNASAPASALGTQANEVFSTIALLGKLAASEYTPEHNATYPETEFGAGLKQIAQLIKAEVGLEVACVDSGGWDTHDNETPQIAAALGELGQGLRALHDDLGPSMANVTVVTMSEFGRRIEENASHGTDHGHGNVMFVMGGGVNGGLHTHWPGLQPDQLDNGDLAITTDYRDVLAEIVTLRLLNPALGAIFPGFTPTSRGIVRAR